MNYLVLGSRGFLGTTVVKSLISENQKVSTYDRLTNAVMEMNNSNVIEYDKYIDHQDNICVVNFLAAWGMSDETIIQHANHDLPKQLFDKLVARSKPFTWIQISSYFYFYYYENRVDKDTYSYWKRIFSSHINKVSKANNFINIIEIYLPHLYGEGDKSGRLIRILTEFKESDQAIEISSGRQFIPILKVDDCAKEISRLLSDTDFTSKSKQIYIKEAEQLTIKELVSIIQKHQPLKVIFGKKLDRQNEFYNKIQSPFLSYVTKDPVSFDQYLLAIKKDENE